MGLGLYSLLRPYPLPQVARRLDQELGLKDRLATALELEERRPGNVEDWHVDEAPFQPGHLAALQQHDALAVAQRLDPHGLAWGLPRRPLWLAGGLALLLLALLLLPNPMDAILAERAAIQAAAENQARAVEEARREFEAATEPVTEERARALAALAELMKALAANPGNREQALADISAAQEKLRNLQSADAAARLAVTEQLAAQLAALSQDEARPAGDMAAAGRSLSELAAAAGSADAASRESTAKTLESMAAQAAATEADLAAALFDLATSLAAGDTAAALSAADAARAALARADQEASLQQALTAAQAALENGRQQLAVAGQSGNQLVQSNGAGQNQGQGQGQGQGQSPGSGGGTQANQLPGATRSGAARAPNQPNRPATVTEAETVYAPGRDRQAPANPEFVWGQETDQGQGIIREEQAAEGAPNPALVPYREVYQSYAEAATETMERERIPAELQDYVRDYFSQLAPE